MRRLPLLLALIVAAVVVLNVAPALAANAPVEHSAAMPKPKAQKKPKAADKKKAADKADKKRAPAHKPRKVARLRPAAKPH